jgi:hypothetical protein
LEFSAMTEMDDLVQGFREYQNVDDWDANFPGLIDSALFENIAAGYNADLAERYPEPDSIDCYNRLTMLLLTLQGIRSQDFDVGQHRRSQRLFDDYQRDDREARELLRRAAKLHQLPADHYDPTLTLSRHIFASTHAILRVSGRLG